MLKTAVTLERIKGVEPSCSAWEADVLPMNYIRAAAGFRVTRLCGLKLSKYIRMARLIGIEPTHPAPEAGALSTELQALGYSNNYTAKSE